MSQLSPAAQAVQDAACTLADLLNREVSQDEMIAAALRALAEQVVPVPRLPYDSCCDVHAAAIRSELLAIAAELEGGR